MQFLEEEILEITETTWQSMLGLDIRPGSLPASMGPVDGYFTGKVEISGAWTGAVLLHGSRQLAQAAADMIFSHEPGGGSEQDSLDAMYELTNIIGGNIKSLLPEPCQLSLPTVEATTDDHLRVLGMERMSELVFDCQDQPLFVSVWQRL
ncbi:MAG: chemotaxis protein CheX [Nitrospirota bacterium]|nr:chemotaxis protein CheX [Nitrospirota bacterium]